jgi:hypothetical protein
MISQHPRGQYDAGCTCHACSQQRTHTVQLPCGYTSIAMPKDQAERWIASYGGTLQPVQGGDPR